MPVKEADVKTFETYKKAIRLDVTKISENRDTKFWVYKDLELPDRTGKKQKLPVFLVLVDDAGVRTFLHGKKPLCKGTCLLQNQKVAFVALKGRVPYRQMKIAVPLLLGKPLHIPQGEEELDEGEITEETKADETSQSPVVVAAPGPDLVALWKKLVADMQAVIARDPGRKDALTRAAAGIPDLIKANNAKEAVTRMDRVREVAATSRSTGAADVAALKAAWDKLIPRIKAANYAGLTHAAAEAGQKLGWLVKTGKLAEARLLIVQLAKQLDHLKTAVAKPASGDITAAWKKLVPDLEKQSRVHPKLKDAAMRTRSQVEQLIRAGKFEAARHAVEALAKILAKTNTEARTAKQEAAGEGAQDAKKVAFERKRQQMEKDIQRAMREWPEGAGEVRAAVGLAGDRAQRGDYSSGLRVLAGLEALLREAAGGEEETAAPGLEEYRQTLRAFSKVRARAEQQIDALATAIEKKDPGDSDVIEALTEELEESVGDIQSLIDAATVAAADEKAPSTAALKSRVQNALKMLGSNVLLQHVQKNPYGVTIDIRPTMMGALKNILESMPVEV